MTLPCTVSVVVPVYNAARFAPRAIASALAGQDGEGLAVLEVIAVNDRSTDDSRAVLDRLAVDEPRLQVLGNAANLGPAGTRNAGISAARGDWIAVLDADDAFAPGRLPRLVAAAEAGSFDIMADLPVFWDLAVGATAPVQLPASGRVQRLMLADLLRPEADTGLDLGLLKPVFRRHLVDNGFWRYPQDMRHGEDFALYFDLIRRGTSFGLLHEAHYVFSTRIGAISGSYSPGSVTNVDYRALAAHAEALARRHAAEAGATPEVLALLADRSVRALRQNRIHGWTLLRKREAGRLMRWLWRDPRNRAEMLRIIGAKLAGHRGLPD